MAGFTVYSNSINPVEPVLTIKPDERNELVMSTTLTNNVTAKKQCNVYGYKIIQYML